MSNEVCQLHSGIEARIENLEACVKDMKSKLNWIVALLIANLASLLTLLISNAVKQ